MAIITAVSFSVRSSVIATTIFLKKVRENKNNFKLPYNFCDQAQVQQQILRAPDIYSFVSEGRTPVSF